MAVTTPVRATAPPPVVPGSSLPALPAGADAPAPAGRPHGTTVLGMKLFIVADAMVLVALLVAFFTIKGGSPVWPARGVKLGTYLPTTISITAAMAAASMAWMVVAIRRNDQRNAFVAAFLTVILGVAIANAQWYSIDRANFAASDHAYGTLYCVLLGFHLAHVIAGIVMVMVVAGQSLAGHYGSADHEPISATAWFWQYTNVIWTAVVTALFILSPHVHA